MSISIATIAAVVLPVLATAFLALLLISMAFALRSGTSAEEQSDLRGMKGVGVGKISAPAARFAARMERALPAR